MEQKKVTTQQPQQQVKKSTANEIVKAVENSIIELTARGGLHLPSDYSAANALRAAALILQDAVDKDKRPVLESCSRSSIIQSLLRMVVQGLNPLKNQCYFIPYGGKLTLMRSYAGNILLAKRAGMKWINANVVYEGDVFEFKIYENGTYGILRHEQKLENIDNGKIVAAYAVYQLENGFNNSVVMTIKQIKQAWLQGINYRENAEKAGVHDKFGEEMAKKTVINRACKLIVNSSADLIADIADIEIDSDVEDIQHEELVNDEEVSENVLSFDKAEKESQPVENQVSKEAKQNETPF